MDANKLYAIQEVPGKGLGVVATANIPKGTRIISEAPILSVDKSSTSKENISKSLSKDVTALSDAKRQAFFSLHNAFKDETTRERGIFRTNAFPFGSDASTGGIFIESSHINHACIANAQNTWNENRKHLTIHAIRDLEKGEEVTVMYLTIRSNHRERQRVLEKQFRFTCSCKLCCLSPDQQVLSDARLDDMQRLDALVGDSMRTIFSPLQALHDVRKLLQLCDEEGIFDGTVARAYYDAFQIAIYNGDAARAKAFALRACAVRLILEGEDSPKVRRFKDLARDPTAYLTYGTSSQWSSSIDQVPTDVPAEVFEAWLWKEEEMGHAQGRGQYANLRDDSIFPAFQDLPGENDLDLDFFDTQDGSLYRPRKHWCFLAEIVDVGFLFRLRLAVKDKAGQETQVLFYTDGRGRELDPSLVREGLTIAILYPENHGFLDMTVGIRHEEPRLLKIFPVGMDELLRFSDKVQRYATDVQGEKTCQGCERKATTLKKCGRCSLFWYCDKACQTRAWNEKGHKGDCRLLRDVDLQLLLGLRGGFEHHLAFSSG